MKPIIKYILFSILFVVCVGAGYSVVTLMKGNNSETIVEVDHNNGEGLNDRPIAISDSVKSDDQNQDSIIHPGVTTEPDPKPNSKPKSKLEPAPVQKMTTGEFQSLLLNLHDNSLIAGRNLKARHPKVAESVSLSFEGMREGERRPTDIQEVRDKIANEQWESARVVSLGYDANGHVNAASIKPIYPEGDQNDE